MLRPTVLLTLAALSLTAQTVDRTKPPQTPPIPTYKLPPVIESKLANGMSIVLVEDNRFPLVTARLMFLGGARLDPADLPGLAEATAAVLTEGTKTRTSRQISEEVDTSGGALGAGAGPDAFTISASALSDHLSRMLVLVADVARNATFPQDEVDLHKQNREQELMSEKSDPSFLASEKMAELLYGSSSYAHIAPTTAAIRKLEPKMLATYRDTYLVPNNAVFIMIGKLPARDAVLKVIGEQFGSWQQKTLPPFPKTNVPAPKRQIVIVDRPGSVQADVHVGRIAPNRLSSDFFPLLVADNILGGGTNSRMFLEIREKQGFAYDAHSEYSTKRESADFEAVTEVRNEVMEPALRAVLAEMDKMAAAPVSAQELTGIKNFMAGLYLLRLETQDGLANQLNNMKALGLPNDYLETYTTKVRSVEPAQIQSVAKKYIAPAESTIVVVGDASKIGDAVKKVGEVKVVKPAE
jgi:zinc protease